LLEDAADVEASPCPSCPFAFSPSEKARPWSFTTQIQSAPQCTSAILASNWTGISWTRPMFEAPGHSPRMHNVYVWQAPESISLGTGWGEGTPEAGLDGEVRPFIHPRAWRRNAERLREMASISDGALRKAGLFIIWTVHHSTSGGDPGHTAQPFIHKS